MRKTLIGKLDDGEYRNYAVILNLRPDVKKLILSTSLKDIENFNNCVDPKQSMKLFVSGVPVTDGEICNLLSQVDKNGDKACRCLGNLSYCHDENVCLELSDGTKI